MEDNGIDEIQRLIIHRNMADTLSELNMWFHDNKGKDMPVDIFMDIQKKCWEKTKEEWGIKIDKR